MREIKFRAWDKEKKVMLSPKELTVNCFLLCPQCGVFGQMVAKGVWDESLGSHLIPLQFTGRKDKNGKEIYKSDLIKWGKHEGLCQIK